MVKAILGAVIVTGFALVCAKLIADSQVKSADRIEADIEIKDIIGESEATPWQEQSVETFNGVPLATSYHC